MKNAIALPPLDRALHALLILAVPLALVALSARIAATQTGMRLEYATSGITAPPGMSIAERDVAADATRRYAIGVAERSEIEALRRGSAPLYEPAEIEHMDDVRTLFKWVWALGAAAWIYILVSSRMPSLRHRIDGSRAIARGGALTMSAVVALGVGVLVSFDALFTRFHELLFTAGTWTFTAESGLISLFPERFWRDGAAAIAVLLFIGGLWFWLIYRRRSAR